MIFRIARNLLLVDRLATPAKKHHADIITLSPYLRDKVVQPPVIEKPGTVAILIRTIRPVIVLIFRVWMFVSAAVLIMALGGCADLIYPGTVTAVPVGHGVTELRFVESTGGAGRTGMQYTLNNAALEQCPKGYEKLAESVTPEGSVWKVRCHE